MENFRVHFGIRARRLLSVLSAVVLAAGTAVLVSVSAASAASSCSGSLIDTKPMTDDGNTYGTLYVYYDAATGKNCAKATNGAGGTYEMIAWISRCAETSPGNGCRIIDTFKQGVNYDRGHFRYYAGPVYTAGSAAGRCIEAYAQIEVGPHTATASVVGHCG